MKSQNLVKVNIGSGPIGKPDWINLDWGILPVLSKIPWLTNILVKLGYLTASYNKPWPSHPRLHDCRKKLPFSDHSVDYVYTSHFLEHLSRYQAIELLEECRRILKPGGVIRIVVPDLAILADKYVKRDKLFYKGLYQNSEVKNQSQETIADQFVQSFYGYDSWSKPNFMQKIHRIFIRGHLWMYDYQSLKILLRNIGFTKIHRCKTKKGQVPDISYLDIHHIGSIYIEVSE